MNGAVSSGVTALSHAVEILMLILYYEVLFLMLLELYNCTYIYFPKHNVAIYSSPVLVSFSSKLRL
jgi:hypothetical protein